LDVAAQARNFADVLYFLIPHKPFSWLHPCRPHHGAADRSSIPSQIAEITLAMIQAGRVQEYLTKLTPTARGNLLTELERLEACGEEIAGSEEIMATLRAEFRTDESTQARAGNASRYFFAPLEPLLIDGAPEHANSGRILRGSLAPIWEWISRDLLPTMARDYAKEIKTS
jgi:hypothetical protein